VEVVGGAGVPPFLFIATTIAITARATSPIPEKNGIPSPTGCESGFIISVVIMLVWVEYSVRTSVIVTAVEGEM